MNKKIVTISLLVLLSFLLALFLSQVAEAYRIPEDLKPINSPFELNTYGEGDGSEATVILLQIIAGALLYFAAPVAIIMIVQAGFSMVSGGADSEKITQAKKHLTWTLIGLGLIILSYSIVRIVLNLITTAASPQ